MGDAARRRIWLSAIAGPIQVVLRSPVALQGKNFATIAEFDVAEGECVPFVLTHGPSHMPPPAMADWRVAMQETESFWRAWSARCSYTGRSREAVQLQNRDAEASALFDRLLSLRNDVGLLAEEYDPLAQRQVGNFPQAFSHLALIGTALHLHDIGPSRSRCRS